MSSNANLQTRIKELEAAHRRTQTVAEISARMSVAAEEQEILSELSEITKRYNVSFSSLSYFHTDDTGKTHTIEFVALQSGDGQPIPLDTVPNRRLSAELHPFVQLIADTTDQPLFVEDAFADPRFDEALLQQFKENDMAALIILPLKTGDRWHGVIGLNWPEPQTFDVELRQLLAELTPRITDVVAGRRAYLAEQAIRRQAEALFRMSQDLISASDDAEIHQIAARPFLERGAVSSDLVKVELNSAGEPEWIEYLNTILESPEGFAIPVGTRRNLSDFPSYSRLLVDHPEEATLISDVASDERLDENLRERILQVGHQALAFVPLSIAGRVVGLIEFIWSEPHEFSAEEKALFDALPALVAPAVENRRLMANLTQMVEARTAEIREKQQLLQTFLENFPATVFAKDREGRLTLANERVAQAYGLPREELIGKTVDDLPYKENIELLQEAESQVLETGIIHEREYPLPQGDEVRTLHSTLFPLYDEQEQISGTGEIVIDITERKQVEAERERLQQEVIDAQRAALRELSSPIIPVMEGIIVLPLIGSVDTSRAREITRSLLRGITEHRAKVVIMDITGVPVVDSGVADHLNKSIQAARLKGAQAIITGMSDAVAETLVDLGIDWSELQTLRDLQTGLTEAIRRLGIDIAG